MRFYGVIASCAAACAVQARTSPLPLVSSDALIDLVKVDDLRAGLQKLQDFADGGDGTRAFGSKGSQATIDWLVDELTSLDYYNVGKQEFVEQFASGNATLTVNGEAFENRVMLFSPGGAVTGTLVSVSGNGCVASDYPENIEGNIPVIIRGGCNFGPKATLAKSLGAAGVILYNNVDGGLGGASLGSGDYPVTIAITLTSGRALLELIESGPTTAELTVSTTIENRTTFNVIAEAKGGDHDNVIVLGAHSDSVTNGPGINDDGSGVTGLLTVAKALAGFSTNNRVRFTWFSAEEFGLLGSYKYVSKINQTESEIAKVRAYLNFDMIASPNYVLGIYDGDGSMFNLTGPSGSDAIEAGFRAFFETQGSPSVETVFDGRSDYRAFLENGIAAGGLFTGAERLKTAEEARLFGGVADQPYDANYHIEGDTIENVNYDAFLLNTKAIADAVARYGVSLDTIPTKSALQRRAAVDAVADLTAAWGQAHQHEHDGQYCGGGHFYI